MGLPKTLLVATDFSTGGERAGQVAIDWADRLGAELHWVHGAEHLGKSIRPSAEPLLATYVEKARTLAVQKLDDCVERSRDRGVRTESHIVDAPPAANVVRLAEKLGADCLIVGTRGHTGLKRLWLGSVAERIVRDAPCRVLVVRGDSSPTSPGTIVLGDDLKPFAAPARADAVALASEFGAGVHVVHSIDVGVPYLSSVEVAIPTTLFKDAYEKASEQLAAAADCVGNVSIANYVVSEGPAVALCDHAEKMGAGLIVVGSRSRHGVDHALLGSVAESVVRRAPCSVLVVR